jgi:hypothetical protein
MRKKIEFVCVSTSPPPQNRIVERHIRLITEIARTFTRNWFVGWLSWWTDEDLWCFEIGAMRRRDFDLEGQKSTIPIDSLNNQPEKDRESEQCELADSNSILLCVPIPTGLIVEWKTTIGRLHCVRRPNLRAENLSPPSKELFERKKSLIPPFTRDEDWNALLPSFLGIETRVRERMNENRVKSERTFEIPCRELLLEIIAEWRLECLSPFLTQENKQKHGSDKLLFSVLPVQQEDFQFAFQFLMFLNILKVSKFCHV